MCQNKLGRGIYVWFFSQVTVKRTQSYYFGCCFIWVWNLVPNLQAEGAWEQSAEAMFMNHTRNYF
jgi:hypothetical protein